MVVTTLAGSPQADFAAAAVFELGAVAAVGCARAGDGAAIPAVVSLGPAQEGEEDDASEEDERGAHNDVVSATADFHQK